MLNFRCQLVILYLEDLLKIVAINMERLHVEYMLHITKIYLYNTQVFEVFPSVNVVMFFTLSFQIYLHMAKVFSISAVSEISNSVYPVYPKGRGDNLTCAKSLSKRSINVLEIFSSFVLTLPFQEADIIICSEISFIVTFIGFSVSSDEAKCPPGLKCLN